MILLTKTVRCSVPHCDFRFSQQQVRDLLLPYSGKSSTEVTRPSETLVSHLLLSQFFHNGSMSAFQTRCACCFRPCSFWFCCSVV